MAKLRTRPPLFRSKKTSTTTNTVVRNVSNISLGDHDFSDGNFLLDSYRSGFKSTQQLEIDFSQFRNHTFFSPARAKVDLAFHKCINEYPYTGSLSQIESFLTRLTGFERYVFDQIPKNKGYLFFSGTQSGESSGGTYISVSPFSGNEFDNSPGGTGELALMVDQNPFEIEAQVYVPTIINGNQIICQRNEENAAFTLALSSSFSTGSCKIVFLVSSASDSYVVASGSLSKGRFNQIRACLSQDSDGKRAKIYVENSLIASSSDIMDFGSLVFESSLFNIGSGSTHTILDYSFEPAQTLSGAIDEFRFFSTVRDDYTARTQKNRQIFATSSLQLYFRFDEPSGSYDMDDIVLDYSGHCLNARIQNFNHLLRNNSSIVNPMNLQDPSFSPVLYPDFGNFSNFVEELITSASEYDGFNPNMVFNLIPVHYLKESATAAGLQSFDSGIGIPPEIRDLPGTGELQNSSPLIRILTIMSVSLDEIKQFVDSMSALIAIEPGDEEQVSSQMIRYSAEYFGIDLPNFFSKSTTSQFVFGENISEDTVSGYSLKVLRDNLWRRILFNMPYIISSKGTRGAVRSILLASGIIPENFFTIREYGMAGEARVSSLRDVSQEVLAMLDFSGSLNTATGSLTAPGVRLDSPRIIGSFLSGSRTEIGFPDPAGTLVNKDLFPMHGISNNANDGLFTSGSFSVEASFVFDKRIDHFRKQSLLRLITTGSTNPRDYLIANVFFDRTGEETGNLALALHASAEVPAITPAPLVLAISGVNLFNGDVWTVGFERRRKDETGFLSSSYTLRCANQTGDQVSFFKDSAFYSETSVFPSQNIFENVLPTFNASGSYLIIGSQSFSDSPRFLNSYKDYVGSTFSGKVSNIRFESTAIGDTVFIERSRNFSNIGTANPEFGLGFDLVQTGAFQRIRVDASCDQATTSSNASGDIRIFDFSQNSNHLSGSGFLANTQIIKPQIVTINRLSPRFDLQQVYNKVRVRGLDNTTITDPNYAVRGPVYEIYDVDEIIDDIRFAIEHSVVKALNEDVISTIGDPQYLDDALGRPIDLFSDSYPHFDHFSDVYFNRLTGKIDLARTYDVFRWVDVALTDLVESILPKRTKFMGINYIIEPHILERAKFKYRYDEMFMLADKETGLKFDQMEALNFTSYSTETVSSAVQVKSK